MNNPCEEIYVITEVETDEEAATASGTDEGLPDATFALLAPSTWNEAGERQEVLREFLALDKHTAALADAYAARLGISRSRFYELVNRLREAGEGPLPAHAALGASRLAEPLEEVVTGAIKACGRAAPLDMVANAIDAICGLRHLAPPSRSAIRRRVVVATGNQQDTAQPTGPVLDDVDLDLEIQVDGSAPTIPILTTILDPGSRLILGHSLDIEGDLRQRVAAALRSAMLSADRGGEARPVALQDDVQDRIVEALLASRPGRRGSALIALTGPRLGSVALLTRRRSGGRRRRSVVTGVDTARAAVRRLVAIWNNGRHPEVSALRNLLELGLAG